MSESATPGMIDSFKNKAREWAKDVVKLYETPVPPALKEEKAGLLKTAGTIKKSIETIFGTFDELRNIGLGFFPLLIPAAVILGASAAIYKWYTDFDKFKQKLAYHKTLMEGGQSADAATKIVDGLTGEGAAASKSRKTLLIGAAVIGLYFYFKKRG